MEGEAMIHWNYSAEWLKSSGLPEMPQEKQCIPQDP